MSERARVVVFRAGARRPSSLSLSLCFARGAQAFLQGRLHGVSLRGVAPGESKLILLVRAARSSAPQESQRQKRGRGGRDEPAVQRAAGSYNNVWSKKESAAGGVGASWLQGNTAELEPPVAPGDGCAGCGKALNPMFILSAMGKDWHEKCFVCAGCGKGFDDEPFVTTPWHPDTPFHRGCVPKRKAPSFAPKTLMSR